MRRGIWGSAAAFAAVLLMVLPSGASATYDVKLKRYPYLTDLVSTSVMVNWATDISSTTATVRYGLAGGTCVSRYDVFLYTHATAKLSYHDQPVLVQVSLIHRGGIGSSVPAAHAGAVRRGLEGYIDLFVTQIRDANK